MDDTISVSITGDSSDLEAAMERAVEAIGKASEAVSADWSEASKAYEVELDKRISFDRRTAEQSRRIAEGAAEEEAQAWRHSNSAILAAEDSFVRDLFTKRQTLGEDLVQTAGRFLEKELSADLKYWTERRLLALEGVTSEKETEEGGVLMHGIMNLSKTTSTQASQSAQTGAVIAGVAARKSAETAGTAASGVEGIAAAAAQISNDAHIAAANTYAAVSQIPVVGPFLAPAAAATAFGAVMAFDALTSLDVGAWEIPQNMPAFLHKGEMVVPENFANGLRGAGNNISNGGDTTNNHVNYSPTINLANPQTWQSLLRGHASDIVSAISNGYRYGMPQRPSMATV
jgi:hypothetical protein